MQKWQQRWLLLLAALLASTFAMAVEELPYRVLQKNGNFELRDYAAHLVAETRVTADIAEAGNIGFGRLFRYISGSNAAQREVAMTAPVVQAPSEKIAMTAPVVQAADGESFIVAFIVPSAYTRESAPKPLDPSVYIREVPAQRIASWRYSGRWTEANFREGERQLREHMAKEGLEANGAAMIARYNSPFMPAFLRRNEVLIPVNTAVQP